MEEETDSTILAPFSQSFTPLSFCGSLRGCRVRERSSVGSAGTGGSDKLLIGGGMIMRDRKFSVVVSRARVTTVCIAADLLHDCSVLVAPN